MEPTQQYIPEDKLTQLQSEVSDFCDAAAKKRSGLELSWRLARMFVAGHQWNAIVNKDSTLKEIDEVRLPGRMSKWTITVNRLLPGVDTRLAHVLRGKPIGLVMPETQDEEDRNAARVANEVVEYDFRTLDYEGKMAERAGPECFTTGNVFFKWYWDPMAGPLIEKPVYEVNEATGEPMIEPVEIEDPANPGQPIPSPSPTAGKAIIREVKEIPRGEPALVVVDPEELYVDPNAKNLDECEMVVHQTLKPVDLMKRLAETWGVEQEKIDKIEAINANFGTGTALIASAKRNGFTTTELATRCLVREVWAKPNRYKGWPDGLWAVIVNDQMLTAQPTPAGSDPIPFAHVVERPVAGEFYATSSVIQAMPIQKALNMTVSRDEYRRTVQRPKLLADYEAGIDEQSFTNEDSEIVQKNAGYAVQWLDAPTYESDPRAAERYVQFIDDLFGNVAILMGQADGEVRSGRQAFIQGEYAGIGLSGPARSIERANQKIGNGILKLRKQNTDEARDIQIVGKNRGIEILNFRSSDLEGAGDYYVAPGSAMPMSFAQKQQMVLDLVDRQILPPDRALKLLPMPSDLDGEADRDRLDRDNATEENMRFMALTVEDIQSAARGLVAGVTEGTAQLEVDPNTGAPDQLGSILKALKLEPRPDFENNDVHLERHNEGLRKTRVYRQLPDAIKALVDEHCDRHLPPPMETQDPAAGGKSAPSQQTGPVGPQGLMPGQSSPVGQSADQAGDVAANFPKMPTTPTSGAQM